MTWPQAFAIFGVCITFAVAVHGMFRWLMSEDRNTADILKASRDPAWKIGGRDKFVE